MNRVHFQVKAQRWCQDETLGDPVSYNKCQFQNLSRNPELVIEKKIHKSCCDKFCVETILSFAEQTDDEGTMLIRL